MEEKRVQNGSGGGWRDRLDLERTRILVRVLTIAIALTVVLGLAFVGLYFLLGRPWQWLGILGGVAQGLVLFSLAYALVRRGRIVPAVYLVVGGIEIAALAGALLVEGWVIPAFLLVYVAIAIARAMVGRAHNRVVLAVSGVVLVVIALLDGLGVIPRLPLALLARVAVWVFYIVLTLMVVSLLQGLRDERFEQVLTESETLAAELAAQRTVLEERTRDLTRRARYLEATSRIARDVTTAVELEDLLSQTVATIGRQLGFYHVGIYLLDRSGEWLTLEAASSEGGRRMIAREHRLLVGMGSPVGAAVVRGEARVVHDDESGRLFAGNPDLRESRSQVALPLRARGEIIGVLDVHSTELQAFDAELVAVLQVLADQVAGAIYTARLFRQSRESLEAMRRASGEAGLERWVRLVRGRTQPGYRYDHRGVLPLQKAATDSEAALPKLVLPIAYGERVFGQIEAHKRPTAGEWTAEERRLIQALTEQLSVALESAQLYEDSQRRATREQLTREITDDIRAAATVDDAIQRAVRRLSQALRAGRVVARLGLLNGTASADVAAESSPPQEGNDNG